MNIIKLSLIFLIFALLIACDEKPDLEVDEGTGISRRGRKLCRSI